MHIYISTYIVGGQVVGKHGESVHAGQPVVLVALVMRLTSEFTRKMIVIPHGWTQFIQPLQTVKVSSVVLAGQRAGDGFLTNVTGHRRVPKVFLLGRGELRRRFLRLHPEDLINLSFHLLEVGHKIATGIFPHKGGCLKSPLKLGEGRFDVT